MVRLGLMQSSAEVRFGNLEVPLEVPDDCGRMTGNSSITHFCGKVADDSPRTIIRCGMP